MAVRKKGSVILPLLTALLPLGAALVLGTAAQAPGDPFEVSEYARDYEVRVRAYASIVAQARDALAGTSTEPILAVARSWSEAREAGALSSLRPVEYGDDSSQGVKAQITRQCSAVVNRLLEAGEREATRKHPSRAFELALAAFRLSETTKDFDLASLFRSTCEQRRALILVEHVLPDLGPREQKRISDAMKRPSRVAAHLAEAEIAQFTEYRAIAMGNPLADKDGECLIRLKELSIQDDCRPLEVQRILRETSDAELPEVVTEIRSAAASERALGRRAASLLQRL